MTLRPLALIAAAVLTAGVALAAPAAHPARTEYAILAGGCFWCTEADMEKTPGVVSAQSGYTGGTLDRPSYEDVLTERTGHYEAVKVIYDPRKITYDALLRKFWPTIDPTDGGGQFCDRGPSYKSAIFVRNEAQRRAAEKTKAEIAARLKAPIATEILPEKTFWPAEAYHQDYYKKNALRYRTYRVGCGRDGRLSQVWGR